MKTKQKQSNISYNSIDWLKTKCDELIDKGDIIFYIFIPHKAEDDELENHIHIILYPAKQIDLTNWDKHFLEYNINTHMFDGFSKVWKTVHKDSDLEWILYVLHDPVYCKAKCIKEKKYLYSFDEFITNDIRTLNNLIFRAFHETEFYHDLEIVNLIQDKGYSGSDLIKNGYVPIKQACAYHHFEQMIKGG